MKEIRSIFIAIFIQILLIGCQNEPIKIINETTIGVKSVEVTNVTYGSASFSGVLKLPEVLGGDFEYGVECALNAIFTEGVQRIKAISFNEDLVFEVDYSKLTANTQYYYRSYLINNKVVYVGETMCFTTQGLVETGELDSLNNVRSYLLVDRDILKCDSILYGVCYNRKETAINEELIIEKASLSQTTQLDSLNSFVVELKTVLFCGFSYRAFVYIDGVVHYGPKRHSDGNEMITGDYLYNRASFGPLFNTDEIIEMGVCYSNHDNPTIKDKISLTGYLLNLPYGNTYYRSYAKVQGSSEPKYGPVKCVDKSVVVADMVDLGLSVKWATFNLGATVPEEYGDYYAWGETEMKGSYSWSNYKYYLRGTDAYNNVYSKYVVDSRNGTVDNKTELDEDDDVAHLLWGSNWRIPTRAEMNELEWYCSFTYTVLNGIKGYLITSRKEGYEGRSIFIPGSSDMNIDANPNYYYGFNNTNLCYCSSSISRSRPGYIYTFYHNNNDVLLRSEGHLIRPVCPSDLWLNSVSINDSINTVDLVPGLSTTLSPIVKQNDVELSYQLIWSTKDPTIATVDDYGTVTGLSNGTTTITASIQSIVKEYTVHVLNESEVDHEYVDLGLSVKWATVNVGAIQPLQEGGFYAWGDIYSQEDYSWKNYKWYDNTNGKLMKYNFDYSKGLVDNKNTLDLSDDAAHAKWGGNWRTPTMEEFGELIDGCTIEAVSGGYKFTSKREGFTEKYIIIPMVDRYKNGVSTNWSNTAYYWSSSLDGTDPMNAYCFSLRAGSSYNGYTVVRTYGFQVRPVCP